MRDSTSSTFVSIAFRKTTSTDVLRRQVEYYFSEANLPTDRFLQEQLQSAPNGWLALSVFATFKRVQALVPLEGHVMPGTALAFRVEALASALHGHPTLQIRQVAPELYIPQSRPTNPFLQKPKRSTHTTKI